MTPTTWAIPERIRKWGTIDGRGAPDEAKRMRKGRTEGRKEEGESRYILTLIRDRRETDFKCTTSCAS